MARILIDNGFNRVEAMLGGFSAWQSAGHPVESGSSSELEESDLSYSVITVDQLESMLNQKDFYLVNVHIPNEGNIPGTDVAVPFDQIGDQLEQLPDDKDSNIVLYCKADSMSITAAQTLISKGFSNLTILEGGYLAWGDAGYELTP